MFCQLPRFFPICERVRNLIKRPVYALLIEQPAPNRAAAIYSLRRGWINRHKDDLMLRSSRKAPRAASTIWNTSLAAFSVVCVLGLSTQASEARSHKKSWREANASIDLPTSTHHSGRTFSGKASYYGKESGSRTASGQRFNQNAMPAAHRPQPFGTRLEVPHGGRRVVVPVYDRGPFVRGRVLDLSKGAARAIGLTGRGVGQVDAEDQ